MSETKVEDTVKNFIQTDDARQLTTCKMPSFLLIISFLEPLLNAICPLLPSTNWCFMLIGETNNIINFL